MVTSDGKVIGEHAGVHNFTVGQRKGLGVATGSPLYVIQINQRDAASRGRQRRGAILAHSTGAPGELDLDGRTA